MKIAHIASLSLPIPPRGYGGTERIIYDLALFQKKRGHDVVIFGMKSGILPHDIPIVNLRSPKELVKIRSFPIFGRSMTIYHLYTSQFIASKFGFDIVHSHIPTETHLAGRFLRKIPMLLTLHHSPALISKYPKIAYIYRLFKVPCVAISRSQARKLQKFLNIISIVHHGVDVDNYPFCKDKEDFILFIGAIAPHKAPHLAIEIAKQSNTPLIIAGRILDNKYFERYVKRSLGTNVKFIGEISEDLKRKLLCKARALLYPVQWDEPFGLILIEAMACGTPVIGTPKGSLPEIIKDGETGYICNSVEEFVKAVKKCQELNPTNIRKYAKTTFSIEKMYKRYMSVYINLLESRCLNREIVGGNYC